MGHSPSILCSKHEDNLSYREIYEGIKIIRHPKYSLPKLLYLFNLLNYEHRLNKFIQKNSIYDDVILARHPYYAYSSCQVLEKPIIYIQATVWPRFQDITSKNRNIGFKIAAKSLKLQNYYIEKKAIEMSDRIVVLSEIRRKEICDYYQIERNKFLVIQPGVDLEKFKPRERDLNFMRELNLSKECHIILTVCRLSPEKNVDMIIRSFAKLRAASSILIVVGDGPERTYLEKLTKRLCIAERVRFVGMRNDVERFYSLADVFILASTYEGFGQVFLEALASGVPCIGLKSDYPKILVASEEIIQDGVTGYCIDPYSIDDLTEKLDKILSQEDIANYMRKSSRQVCEKKYSWEGHAATILKEIKKL
jgi:glycosyltransferase involved in cell wall biosynthesis